MSAIVDRLERQLGTENLTSHKTFCQICSAFCGLEVITDGKKVIRVLPDKENAFNWRDFCAKGGTANLVRDHPKRLRSPMKRVGDKYVEVSYEQAVKEIAAQLNAIKAKHGADAIGTYMGNPGGTYTAGAMFMGGLTAGIGTHSIFYVGSIDQNNWHVVAREMYGSEMAGLLPDIDHSKCYLMLGTNPADSGMNWMSIVPEAWERVLKAKENGADLIMVDPRQTPSTKKATTHVQIRPGQDWAFLLALIKVVFENGWNHQADCAEANNVEIIKAIAQAASLDQLSQRCNVPVDVIRDVARRFATAETAVCEARTGVALNRNGTLGEWLSHVLNLITGRIDRKGGRTYVPGIAQNFMQLYNKMAPPITRRSRIGNYPAVVGAYPLAILPDEIRTPGPGQVRAMILNSGNPVSGGPDGAKLDAALGELDLLIAVDMFQRESHRHAHWLIPGSHFLERDAFYGISNLCEAQFTQLAPATIAPLNGIKLEWEFFRDLAVEMNVPFMGIRGLNPVIRFSRWLASVTGNPLLAFGPRWIWALMVKTSSKAVKWKDIVRNPQGFFFGEKPYGLFRQYLQTKDKKINAAPDDFVRILKQRLDEAMPQTDKQFPLQIISRRRQSMMNSWLVESAKHPRTYGDYVEINPADAAARQIHDEQPVTISSRVATLRAKVRVTDDMPVGIVGMDQGWGSRLFDPQGGEAPEQHGVMRNTLVAGDEIDELAGAPNLNGTQVEVAATV